MWPYVLKVLLVHFMETTLAISFGSFLAGWFSRDLTAQRPVDTVTKCVCDCNWQGNFSAQESGSGVSWLIVGLIILVLIALVSNAAVALRVSLKDHFTGADKEFTVSVKGKSKGFYGPPSPLRITG